MADFDIAEGDTLVLKEWDGQQKTFTGREIEKQVTYVGKIKGDTTRPQEDVEKFGHQIIAFK